MLGTLLLAFLLVPTRQQPTNPRSHISVPPSFQSLSNAAQHARESNQNDEAIELYRRALSLRPEWDEGLWYLGNLLYGESRFASTRDVLRQFVALRPDAGAGWALLGMSEFQVREYPRALDHLRRSMALGMGDRAELKQSVFYTTTVLLTRFEQYDDSIGFLFGMVYSGQCDGPVLDAAGLAGLRIPLLPSEIPVDRRELIELAGKGLCAAQQGQNDQALMSLRAMAEAYPGEPGVHFLLGSFLMNVSSEEGIAEMKREIEISPSHVPARNRLAEQYVKTGEFDRALDLARQARKLAPKNFSVDLTMGEALLGKGDIAEGIQELEDARTLAPDNTRVRWDLVRAYGQAGRAEDARKEKQEIERLSHQDANPAP